MDIKELYNTHCKKMEEAHERAYRSIHDYFYNKVKEFCIKYKLRFTTGNGTWYAEAVLTYDYGDGEVEVEDGSIVEYMKEGDEHKIFSITDAGELHKEWLELTKEMDNAISDYPNIFHCDVLYMCGGWDFDYKKEC